MRCRLDFCVESRACARASKRLCVNTTRQKTTSRPCRYTWITVGSHCISKGNGADLEMSVGVMKSVGQIIGEVLRQLDDDRFIVKASSGPRYVVGCRSKVSRPMQRNGVTRRR